MSKSPMLCTWGGGAVIAFAALASSFAWAHPASDEGKNVPVVVAQASTPAHRSAGATMAESFPAYERGVREAAAQGNEALRRYIWRTRMIYNFYYDDFALD